MPRLIDPLEVKGLKIKNRIVMPPMYTGLATTEGTVTESLVEHYVNRSSYIGMVIVEHSYVSPEGKLGEKQLGIYDDEKIAGLEILSGNVHSTGTPIVMQINHAGRYANSELVGVEPVAPSSSGTSRQLSPDEIENLVDAFAIAAERTMKAGFDGVEIHGAHGFLLNQFFSPLTNRRVDKYGGSLENRMKFPIEVVRAVRRRIGGRLLLYRLGADDLNPNGTQIADSQKFAAKLEMAGVDIIDVSGGVCGSRPTHLQGTQGYFISQAKKVKEVVKVPVIGVGGVTRPEFANMIIQKGKVDLVAVGRALLRDPSWASKAVKTLEQ